MCDVGRITSKPYLVGDLSNLESGLENSVSGVRHWVEGVAETFVRHLRTVDFLDLIVNPTGITMDPAHVEIIQDWATPKTFKEIQILLGFTNFFRRFIKNYSKIVTLLTDLLKRLDQKKN